MVIALIVCIPVTATVTGFLVFKSIQLGLRWQLETKQNVLPSMEIKNPIADVIQAKTEAKSIEQRNSIMDEWLNGKKER